MVFLKKLKSVDDKHLFAINFSLDNEGRNIALVDIQQSITII